jgi:D-glycero-D-manno-heptose 1,7-bisphosphate phosphatase
VKPVPLLQNVVFLDRDGVINYDSPDYIKGWQEFEFLPGSLEGIRQLTQQGSTIIVVTNQSAIKRQLITLDALQNLHRRLIEAVAAAGGRIAAIYYCPHGPQDNCDCRKPAPGLFWQAQQAFRIDLASAVMVGDSARDIEAAFSAGCGTTVLVKTGNGSKALEDLRQGSIIPDHIADDLQAAAQWISGRLHSEIS